MHKNNGLVTFDAAILVTETCMKNSKCIQIHPVGSKKDSTFKFDVSMTCNLSVSNKCEIFQSLTDVKSFSL